MRVARRRLVRGVRGCIACITCATEKEEVVITDDDVKAMVEKIMNWKPSRDKVKVLVGAIETLHTSIDEEIDTVWGKWLCKYKRSFVSEHLYSLCKRKEPQVQCVAFEMVQMFALHGECGSLLATKEMMKLCVSNVKSKNKRVSKAASGALTTLVDHEDARFLAADEGLDKSMTTLIADKSLGVVTKRNCVVTFGRIADDPEVASLMAAKNPDILVKNFFEMIEKTDDTDTEKWALIAMARLALNDEFSNIIEKKGYIPYLFELAADKIPARKLAATLVIAHLARNKGLRLLLVKYRAIQLFCSMAMNTSVRADMTEMQRVAALGIKHLACNWELRSLCGRSGAIEACIFMVKNRDPEVARFAALAIAEMSLLEENGLKFCQRGALKPLIHLARSGDPRSEGAAISAISNLTITPEQQSIMIQDGGTKAVEFLQSSSNPRAAHLAKNLLKRLRMAKLRAACKFAARMKATGESLIAAGVEIGEGYE